MSQKFKIILTLFFTLAFFYFVNFVQAQSNIPTACSYNSQCYGDFYTNINTKCNDGLLPYCLDGQCQCSKYCSNDSDCDIMCGADKISKCEVEVSQYHQKLCQPCSNTCSAGIDCAYLQCPEKQESYCNENQQCVCQTTNNPAPKNFYKVVARMVDQNNQKIGTGAEVSFFEIDESGEGVVGSCFISDAGSGASCSAVLPKGNYKALISDSSDQFFVCVSPGCPVSFSIVDKDVDLTLRVSKATDVPSNFCKEYGGRDFYTKGSVIANFVGYVDSCRGGGMLFKHSCSGGLNIVTKFQCPGSACYDGACVKSCDYGYECKAGDQLNNFRLQCPNQKIKYVQFFGPHCNMLGGDYCVACKPECDVNSDCLGFSCKENQIPQCLNEKCLCQNVSPDLTIISDIYYQQKIYNENSLITGLSINIKNVGSTSTLVAPKVNLYDITNSQKWQLLNQAVAPSILNIGTSAMVMFGGFSFSAPGIYNLRACVDDDPNEIAESNENNNCSDVLSIEIKATQLTCSNCGKGILNTCDKQECEGLGDCIFFNGFLGLTNKCFNQADCKSFCQRQETSYVCGNDGKSYVNECMAKCNKQEIIHSGQCGQQVVDCASVYGAGWWCGIYDDWKGQCSGNGTYQLLGNKDTCKETGEKYCITCGVKTIFKAQSVSDKTITIEGAQISLEMNDSSLGNSKVSCATGKEGTCSMVLIPGVKYFLTALSNGYSCANCVNNSFTAKLDDGIHILTFGEEKAKCSTYEDCANLSCPTNQKSQCLDAQCVCKDIAVSPEKIDCQKEYGAGWWCGSYDDWKGQCYGAGSFKDLANLVCNEKGNGFCNTCGVKTTFSVIAGANKEPVAGAQVFLSPVNSSGVSGPGVMGTNCVTDERGYCSLNLIPGIEYFVNALSNGYICNNCSDNSFVAKLDDYIHTLIFEKATTPIKCSTAKDCANLSCPTNQKSQCLDAQCVCKDIAVSPEKIDCQKEYGEGYQCNTYVYWQKTCSGGGKFVELLNGAVCDDLGVGRGCLFCPTNICSIDKDCSDLFCSTNQSPRCVNTQCLCEEKTKVPSGLINCQLKYNSAYWCSNYVDWTTQCANRADPDAIKQEGFCNENGGDYCVTCASIQKPPSSCSDCGKGIFNVCDVKECQKLGKDCAFSEGKCFVEQEKEIIVPLPNSSGTKMIIPEGTFLVSVAPNVSVLDSNSVDASGLSSLGNPLKFLDFSIKDTSGNEIHNFANPITIQVSYANEDLGNYSEDNLKLYIFNETLNQWEALPTIIDKKNKVLKAQTNHFSIIAGVIGSNPCDPCSITDSPPKGGCLGTLNCIDGKCQSDKPILCSMTKFDNPEDLIDEISKWIFTLALIIAPLMILLGGFYMLTAAGDPKKSTQGKQIITWALIGLGVILAAKAFISIITSVLK